MAKNLSKKSRRRLKARTWGGKTQPAHVEGNARQKVRS